MNTKSKRVRTIVVDKTGRTQFVNVLPNLYTVRSRVTKKFQSDMNVKHIVANGTNPKLRGRCKINDILQRFRDSKTAISQQEKKEAF